MSRLLVLAIAAVTAATAGASTPPYRVRTLATAPSIWWFGQDHGWLAWATERRYRFVLTVRKGRRHGRIDLGLERGNENTVIAQAGPRILWTDFASGNIFYQYLFVGWATGGRGGFFREYDSDAGDGTGDHVGAVAGDGTTLVHSVVTVGYDPPDCDPVERACGYAIYGDRVYREDRKRPRGLAGTPPAALLAAAGARFAAVPAAYSKSVPWPGIAPAAAGPVSVHDVRTGSRICAFTPSAQPLAVALSTRYVAVLTGDASARRIEIHDAASCAPIRNADVPAKTAPELSISGSRVVFHSGRDLRMLDVVTGAAVVLGHARSTPVGLSIERNRVAWAEQYRRDRSRVRAILL